MEKNQESAIFSYDPYEVNIVRAIKLLEKSVKSNPQNIKQDGFVPADYFHNLWELSEWYYKSIAVDLPYRFKSFSEHKSRGLLLVPSNHVFFQAGLTIDLIAREEWEIHPLLDYNAENFLGYGDLQKESFPIFIEKIVLRHISIWSPFKDYSRQNLIMSYVAQDQHGADEFAVGLAHR